MKKLLITSFALIGGLAICSTASAAITTSAHNFATAGGFMGAGAQICVPCHAPHNNKNGANEVLWNHKVTTEAFTMYSSPTLDGAIDAGPTGVSKFCLSCHDGVTAIDAYAAHLGTQNIGAAYVGTTANIGTALTNDHPVSVVYDVTDTGLKATGTLPANIPLFDGKVQCASCHDVHNKYDITPLLNHSMTGSALCLQCHNK